MIVILILASDMKMLKQEENAVESVYHTRFRDYGRVNESSPLDLAEIVPSPEFP